MVVLALGVSAYAAMVRGSPPRVDRLAELEVGRSSGPDVIRVIGAPNGNGASRLFADFQHRDVWLYEYVHASLTRNDITYLLVYFRDGRYDGHLWFSTLHPPSPSREP